MSSAWYTVVPETERPAEDAVSPVNRVGLAIRPAHRPVNAAVASKITQNVEKKRRYISVPSLLICAYIVTKINLKIKRIAMMVIMISRF